MPRSRAALHAVLGGWGVSQDVLESAELVLSELVTNALRVPVPRDRQVGVRIARSLEDGLLRLEVSDAGAGKPEVRVPCDEETGGRGLLLVEAMAHRWGVEDREGGIGKTVWAELKAPDIVAGPVGSGSPARGGHMSAQHAETPHPGPPHLRTVADIRAALRNGQGFPGDAESFEADLARALDTATATDLHQVADVIKTYAGSIRDVGDPGFDDAVQEGLDLGAEIKKATRSVPGHPVLPLRRTVKSTSREC
ncbi:ATP-binding protein [Streptomyces antibioticus]|uniref:ATP-binding protein n=1 Tax=Streptomyces antibioticus TaxID=1890 RepID=UPI0033DC93D1